jgi:peptidoglycan/xylan/chitin deacetylase (PgdA/CDA1 family)
MLRSLAKVAVTLNVDSLANTVVERFYRNSPAASRRLSRRFQILGYHKVSPDPHPFFAPITPELFETQMQFLKSCYRVMRLDELVARNAKGDLPDRAVAITFDDGYRDNFDFAFPILKKYQLPATIFVATGAIGTGRLIWHDRVFDAFRFATALEARLNDAEIPQLILDTPERRQRSLDSVLVRAKALYGDARRRFVEDLEEKLKPRLSSDGATRMLNWEQVREMHNAGIDFGSHTVSHTILSRIPREDKLKELRESKAELSERLGAPVTSFAYPNGKAADYNAEAKSVLKDCGYALAVTCESGFNYAATDTFELKRGLPWQKEIELFRFNFFLQRHGLAS